MDKEKAGKKKVFLNIAIILIIASGCYYFYGQFFQKKNQEEQKVNEYAIFQSSNAIFDFSFEYPRKRWFLKESQGGKEKYAAVYLNGPIQKDFGTLIAITVRPLQAGKGASELIGDYLKMHSYRSKFKIIRKKRIDVDGVKAFGAIHEYETRLPREGGPEAQYFFINDKTIFLIKNNQSYEFTFLTMAGSYKAHLPVFEHVLKTFKFKK